MPGAFVKQIRVDSIFLTLVDNTNPPPPSTPFQWLTDNPTAASLEVDPDGTHAIMSLINNQGSGILNVIDSTSMGLVASASFSYDKTSGTFSFSPNAPQ